MLETKSYANITCILRVTYANFLINPEAISENIKPKELRRHKIFIKITT
jgi:hypothetical protein